jgi:hypothetical protein
LCVLLGIALIVAGVYLLAGAGWAVLCLGGWVLACGVATLRAEG